MTPCYDRRVDRFERDPERPAEAASRLLGTSLDPARMANLHAAVAGVGALGEAVVRMLAMAGVGRLLLVDPDVVAPSNLSRSIFYRKPGVVGLPKVDVAARVGRRLFPETRFEPRRAAVADVGTAELAEADLIFGCLDSESARVELAYLATKLDKPVCDGGLAAPGAGVGRVSWFPSRARACFCCGLRHSRRRELLETFDSSPKSCSAKEEQQSVRASTPTQAAIIAALQIEVALAGGEEAYSLEAAADFSTSRHRLPRADLCPFHDAPAELIEARAEETFADLLRRSSLPAPPAVVLDWPIAWDGRCSACSYRAPAMRADRLSRTPCPDCGAALEAGEIVRRIAEESPWAERRPSDLGLAPRRLYTVESLGPAQ